VRCCHNSSDFQWRYWLSCSRWEPWLP